MTEFIDKPNKAMKPETHKLAKKTLVDILIFLFINIMNEMKLPTSPINIKKRLIEMILKILNFKNSPFFHKR